MIYKDLDAWKKAIALTAQIYSVTKSFPSSERFALSSQLRRAAVSIPSNVAEGCGRSHKKETAQFLHISRGSLYEVETQLIIADGQGYLKPGQFTALSLMITDSIKTVHGLLRYLESSNLK